MQISCTQLGIRRIIIIYYLCTGAQEEENINNSIQPDKSTESSQLLETLQGAKANLADNQVASRKGTCMEHISDIVSTQWCHWTAVAEAYYCIIFRPPPSTNSDGAF